MTLCQSNIYLRAAASSCSYRGVIDTYHINALGALGLRDCRGFYVLVSDITPGATLVSPEINQSDQISPYILF